MGVGFGVCGGLQCVSGEVLGYNRHATKKHHPNNQPQKAKARKAKAMNKLLVIGLLTLLMVCVTVNVTLAQNKPAPFTKAEILRRLKPIPGQRYEQADLIEEIEQRGIAFTLDEKTLNELRQAGARSFLIQTLKSVDPNAPKGVPETTPAPEPL